jgi:hypothetical protein
MHFSYDGFEHEAGRRSFFFRQIDTGAPPAFFSIKIDVALLAQNRVSMQDAPLFCLNLLESASHSEPGALDRLHNYQVVFADFGELNRQRSKRDTELRLRSAKRPPVRSRTPTLPVGLFKAKDPHAV